MNTPFLSLHYALELSVPGCDGISIWAYCRSQCIDKIGGPVATAACLKYFIDVTTGMSK